MEAFSDGVFAIVITLLVLELTVPEVSEGHLGRALVDQWPEYLAYLVSFASAGTAWLSHTTITEYIDRVDSILLRINLLLLFFVSLLPFLTHMLALYADEVNAERIAVTIYGVNLLAIGAVTSALWHYALAQRLVKPDMHDDDVRALTAKLHPSLAGYGVAIAIGLLLPRAAVMLYLGIALYVMIPFRTIARHLRHHG
jgi:uncharacterized membrane protein